MARKFEEEYRVSKAREILKSENAFRLAIDMRIDAIETALVSLGSDASELVARVVRAIDTEIAPRAAEIEALLGTYRVGVPAASVQEEADGRQFLTPSRRAAILAELRGGVDGEHDTLAKLLALVLLMAPQASPTLTGTPTAPTAAAGTDTAQIATTAFVKAAIDALKGAAPATYDTLVEIANWIANDETAEAALTAAISNRVRLDADGGYSTAQQLQARKNIGAAPYEAVAYANLVINGAMEISQENGSNAGAAHLYHAVDLFAMRLTGWSTGAFSAQQVADAPSASGLGKSLRVTVTTAEAAPGAATWLGITHSVEGFRSACLGWGTPTPRPAVLGFWVKCAVAGTYSVCLRDVIIAASHVATFTVNAPNTWEWKAVAIPGTSSGTWNTADAVGIFLAFTLAVGSTYAAAAGWQSGNVLGVTGQTNLAATAAATFLVTGVVLLPGDQLPTAAQAPLLMRPQTEELRLCRQYFRAVSSGAGAWHAGGATDPAAQISIDYADMRPSVTPTIVSRGVATQISDPGIVAASFSNPAVVANTVSATNATVSFSKGSGTVTFNPSGGSPVTGDVAILGSGGVFVNKRL